MIQENGFSMQLWRFSHGVNLRFDEVRVRPVMLFGLRAGGTYVLFLDSDSYPVVIRLRPTEVNQLNAYRVLLLAGVEDVIGCASVSNLFGNRGETCVTDGGGTFAVYGSQEPSGVRWTRAYITPNCDMQALTLSLTRMAPEPAVTT
jgi:hypothetical protein